MNIEYRNALKEVDVVLNLLSEDMKNKIPQSFLKFIEENKSDEYTPYLDMNLSLSKQKLMKVTMVILSLVYRDYLCSSSQKRRLEIEDIVELKKNEMELNSKYSYDNLFKKWIKWKYIVWKKLKV